MIEYSRNYPPEILKQLQHTELDMLRLFDSICHKYNITYWAAFGTAIGAVRHHGFIPWDDDIDVGIMLEDYEKLIKIPAEEWGDLLLVSGKENISYHHSLFAKLYKKNTILETKFRVEYCKSNGWPNNGKMPIWIDIFIYNHVKDIDFVKHNIKKAVFMRKVYWCCKTGMQIKKSDKFRKKIGCISRELAHKLLNISPNTYLIVYNSFFRFFKKVDLANKENVSCFTCIENEEMTSLFCKEKDMFPVVRVPFENLTIPLLKNNHEILTALYGDYMVLPPENKRINHCPAVLDFGDGKGNVFG